MNKYIVRIVHDSTFDNFYVKVFFEKPNLIFGSTEIFRGGGFADNEAEADELARKIINREKEYVIYA